MDNFIYGTCPVCGRKFDDVGSSICPTCHHKYYQENLIKNYSYFHSLEAWEKEPKGSKDYNAFQSLLIINLKFCKDYFDRLNLEEEEWGLILYYMFAISLDPYMDQDKVKKIVSNMMNYLHSVLNTNDDVLKRFFDGDLEDVRLQYEDLFRGQRKEDLYFLVAVVSWMMVKSLNLTSDHDKIFNWLLKIYDNGSD